MEVRLLDRFVFGAINFGYFMRIFWILYTFSGIISLERERSFL